MTRFKTAGHFSLFWAALIQSIPSNPSSIRYKCSPRIVNWGEGSRWPWDHTKFIIDFKNHVVKNRVLSITVKKHCNCIYVHINTTTTDYGLDGLGSNPSGDEIFRPSRPAPGAHPASCKMGTGSFLGVKCGRGVLPTTHFLLVPRSWKSPVHRLRENLCTGRPPICVMIPEAV